MKYISVRAWCLLWLLVLSACGGGGGGTPANLVGQVIDDPIVGLGYACTGGSSAPLSGTTDSNGHFNYQADQTCTFKVGKITLGTLSRIPSDGKVTPQDLAGVTRAATASPSVVAIAQFLQSLNDGSVSGKLVIPDVVSAAFSGDTAAAATLVSNNGVIAQSSLQSLVGSAGKVLVSPTAATAALDAQIAQGTVSSSTGSVSPTAAPVLNSIAISAAALSTPAGLTNQMTAKAYYSDGSSADITGTATWSSSDAAKLTINAAGLATSVSAGQATVRASLMPAGSVVSVTGSLQLTTTAHVMTAISITNSNSLPAGLTDQLFATGNFSDGATTDLSGLVNWNSSNTATAIVNRNGLVQGVAMGTTTISASYTPSGAATPLAVNFAEAVLAPNPVNLVIASVQANLSNLWNQATALLNSVISYTDGSLQTVSSLVNWVVTSVSGSGSATVTPGTTASDGATLTASSPGVISIIANYLGLHSNSIQLTVVALPPIVQSATVSINVLGVGPSSTTGTIAATDPQGLPLSYSVQTNGSIGTAAIDASSGAFTYTVPGNTSASSDSFSVQVSNGQTTTQTTVGVALKGDPLLQNQWHLQNSGASAFASVMPVPGVDMNVAGAWTAGYTGRGIKVAVVDTGLQIAHEDLSANVDQAHSYNFLTGTSDPSPSVSGEDHGTRVAGIIGAIAFNQKGGRGVAYDATLRGYNLLASGAYSLANLSNSLGLASYSADNDIFNESFASSSSTLPPISNLYTAMNNNVLTMRGGKGAILVQSAGNEFQSLSSASTGCSFANQYGVSCGDPATDTRRGGTVPIVVGAINSDGVRSSFSNTGSSLWVAAPGGEYGIDTSYVSPGSNWYSALFSWVRSFIYKPGIVTTSNTGCSNAAFNLAVNALDSLGASNLASNCQYTATMNGTSSAAPNVSAVVALMLQANPNLGYRDVKYILAKTAKTIDPNNAGVSTNSIITGNPSTVVLDQGWVKNAAGYWFSNSYGFGAVDAAAAVAMAKNYVSYLPAQQSASFSFQYPSITTVPNASPTGTTMAFAAAPTFATVEQVVLVVNVSLSPALYCNQIELTSPSGTKSILMHAANGFSSNGIYQTSVPGARFLSNAFYGEPAAGTWRMRLVDLCSGSYRTYLYSTDVQTLILAGH